MKDFKGILLQILIKKTSGAAATLAQSETLANRTKSAIKNENILNKEVAEELQKPIIIKFQKRKVHLSFIDNIWGTNLADMQLISTFNKEICFLLCVTAIFSKYARVIPLEDKKCIIITKAFQKILKEYNRKLNKIQVDIGTKFYNKSIEIWLEKNIEMYSTHNEEKSVVAGGFIRTLKSKIYEYMTSISKKLYIDKLDDIVNKYNLS